MKPLAWERRPLTREQIDAARQMSPSEKFMEGGRLFDEECEVIQMRISKLLPNASAELKRDLLRLSVKRIHGGND